MLEGQEGIQQDANSGESSAAPETSNQESVTEVSATEQSGQENRTADSQPFHEHPRFKELIEERNTFKAELENMRKTMEERLSQSQQKESKEHPFVARLKEIDPSYGEWAGGVEQLKKDLEEMRNWKQEQSRQAMVQQYESGIEKLHNDNKVPAELRDRIRRELDLRAMTNPKLGLKDLPNVYKDVLSDYNKFIDGIKRSERASYVTDKSKDVKAPATQTKGAPATGNKTPAHKDKESAFSSIVQKALNRSKAEGEI